MVLLQDGRTPVVYTQITALLLVGTEAPDPRQVAVLLRSRREQGFLTIC